MLFPPVSKISAHINSQEIFFLHILSRIRSRLPSSTLLPGLTIKLRNSTPHLAPSAIPPTMKRSCYFAMHAMHHIIPIAWALTEYRMVLGSAWSVSMKVRMPGQLTPQGCIDLVGNQEPLHNAPRHRSGELVVVCQRMTGMEPGTR